MSEDFHVPEQAQKNDRWTSGMAWAVRRASRQPVYIGKLRREDKGLACDCVCPACEAPLQAVAPGLQATSTRVPFFRHHQAQQGPGCKHRVAELAALKLFAERGIIEIPAPRGSAAVVGFSGKVYEKARVGDVVVEKIVSKRVISDIEVELTLASGRTVILTLRGEQHMGEFGSAHAVIQIHVTDPEIAMMSEEEILQQARFSPRFLQLIAHADRSRLDLLAADDARREALEQLDIAPEDLHLPKGATAKQASESLLHWAVKDSLLTVGYLRTPAFRHVESVMCADGKPYTAEVTLPELTLELSDIEWEVQHEGFRPDIVCWAVDRQGGLGRFRLLIEVAKTSTVTATKLARIRAAGLACLQIDVYKFARSGEVSLSEVRPLVANDVAAKEWLCHPVLDRLIAEARTKVAGFKTRHEQTLEEAAIRLAEQRARAAREKEAAEREAARRSGWAGQLTQAQALRELRTVLDRRWAGETEITSNGMLWERGKFEAEIRHLWSGQGRIRSLAETGGLPWRISRILGVHYGTHQELDFKTTLSDWTTMPHTYAEPAWLGLLHLIIEKFDVAAFHDDYDAYASQREQVMASLNAGEPVYARSTSDDAMLVEMFPEIAPVLAQRFGTIEYASDIKRKAAEAFQAKLAEQEAELEAEKLRQTAAQEEAARRKAIEQFGYSMVWNSAPSAPSTPDRVFQCIKVTGSGPLDVRWTGVMLSALKAKLAGENLANWLHGQTLNTTKEAEDLAKLLRNAYLAKSK